MSSRTASRLRTRYESVLWWSMDRIGVDESIERKVVAAVAIQFLVSLVQVVLPFVVSGLLWYALAGGLFLAAAIAFVNTLLIVRRDFVDPIQTLEARANEIAAGEVDTGVDRSGQPDEIGSLTNAFAEMGAYLTTVSEQTSALAQQNFDDPVLDEDVPGSFGESLQSMAVSLEEYTAELETMAERLERRSERLQALVGTFGDAAQRAEEGDLTATIDVDGIATDEEMYREVIGNYNDLVETLAATIGDVQSFADTVSAASDDVATSMVEVDDAGDEVARSVQEISDGAASQTEQLQIVADEMNTLSATVEEIAASADEVAQTAEDAAERGRSGRAAAREAIDELDDLEAGIGEAATAVEHLVGQIAEIDEIVSVIDGIAAETNMLALNASIEAARAGSGGSSGTGDGFAVVADEIKELAAETRESADEITDRIGTIQAESRATVEGVQQLEQQVGGSVATIESALSDFEDIVGVVDDVNATVQDISSATDEQAGTTQEVVRMVDDVASISEETTAEAESVAAAAQQQTATISEVSANVESLSDGADDLQTRLAVFDVETDGRDTTPAGAGDGPAQAVQPQDRGM